MTFIRPTAPRLSGLGFAQEELTAHLRVFDLDTTAPGNTFLGAATRFNVQVVAYEARRYPMGRVGAGKHEVPRFGAGHSHVFCDCREQPRTVFNVAVARRFGRAPAFGGIEPDLFSACV